MRVLRHSLLFSLLFLMTACAENRSVAPLGSVAEETAGRHTEKSFLWAPCTPEEATSWATRSAETPEAAFQAARCYAVLARFGKSGSVRLSNAIKGRKMAETAVARNSKDAAAHYLAGYLTGLEAENDTLKGLSLVPVIEESALAASRLNPGLDHGGPDRMLGELYLRAPEPPVSIGDLEKAVHHYQRAVSQDSHFVENRLGLAEAYLQDEEPGMACHQLEQALGLISPHQGREKEWNRALQLMKRLCGLENLGN